MTKNIGCMNISDKNICKLFVNNAVFDKKILTKLRLYGIISHVVSAPGRVCKVYSFSEYHLVIGEIGKRRNKYVRSY